MSASPLSAEKRRTEQNIPPRAQPRPADDHREREGRDHQRQEGQVQHSAKGIAGCDPAPRPPHVQQPATHAASRAGPLAPHLRHDRARVAEAPSARPTRICAPSTSRFTDSPRRAAPAASRVAVLVELDPRAHGMAINRSGDADRQAVRLRRPATARRRAGAERSLQDERRERTIGRSRGSTASPRIRQNGSGAGKHTPLWRTSQPWLDERGPRPRPQRDHDAILVAARERFSEHGSDRVRMRDVAADAGVDVALITYRFAAQGQYYTRPRFENLSTPNGGADGRRTRPQRHRRARPSASCGRVLEVSKNIPRTGGALMALVRSAIVIQPAAPRLRTFVPTGAARAHRTQQVDAARRRQITPPCSAPS